MHKLRTVDVWDTLLRRRCHPECVKLATAWYLFLGWRHNLRAEYTSGAILYRKRTEIEYCLAEQARRNGKDNEYIITDVFACWIASVFAGNTSRFLVDHLLAYEVDKEIAVSYPDPCIGDFLLLYPAQKTIFLSDFYMNSNQLQNILAKKGVEQLVPEGYSSCDIGLNKRSGSLFRHVHSLYGILPEEHVHVGDHEWSDFGSPSALGIDAIRYCPDSENQKRVNAEELFHSRESLFELIYRSSLDSLLDIVVDSDRKQAAASRLGVESAALFIGFVIWIAEQSITEKLDQIYFFTREGEFFHDLFKVVFPSGSFLGHTLPPIDILEVSRLSTFSASIESISVQEMMRLWSLFKIQNISGLFDTLGLQCADYYSLLNQLGLSSSDTIRDPANDPRLGKLFQSQEFLDAAQDACIGSRSKLIQYLTSKSFCENKRIGVVDIGWRGTIQDNISTILPEIYTHGMYLGLRPFINKQPSNCVKSSFGPNENVMSRPSKLFENFAALELMCNSSNGSVKGYLVGNYGVIADRQIDPEENRLHLQFTEPFQKGVLAAGGIWQPFLDLHVITSQEIRNISLAVWERLRTRPTDELIDSYLNTPQIDTFGYGETFRRNKYPSLVTILLSPFVRSRRQHLTDYVRRAQWTSAISRANDISLIHRLCLVGIFYAAKYFKRGILIVRLRKNSRNLMARVDGNR